MGGKLLWMMAFLLASGLHFLVGAYFLIQPMPITGAKALGSGGFEVSISMVAVEMGSTKVEPAGKEPKEILEEALVAEIAEDMIEDVVVDVPDVFEAKAPEPVVEDLPDEIVIDEIVKEETIIFPRPKTRPHSPPKIDIKPVNVVQKTAAIIPIKLPVKPKVKVYEKPRQKSPLAVLSTKVKAKTKVTKASVNT